MNTGFLWLRDRVLFRPGWILEAYSGDSQAFAGPEGDHAP
jgi:hypothetical protein